MKITLCDDITVLNHAVAPYAVPTLRNPIQAQRTFGIWGFGLQKHQGCKGGSHGFNA